MLFAIVDCARPHMLRSVRRVSIGRLLIFFLVLTVAGTLVTKNPGHAAEYVFEMDSSNPIRVGTRAFGTIDFHGKRFSFSCPAAVISTRGRSRLRRQVVAQAQRDRHL